ncbi:MAG: dipeptide epimerase [Hyphomicrobiales bacterium]|nr:dipeptide epimerase [Hyphomicrobiales bacterium]
MMNQFGSLSLAVAIERFPIAGAFTISRGSRTEAVVVTATVSDGQHVGRAECVPYPRYGETVEGVAAAIEAQGGLLAGGGDQAALTAVLKAGAARNALDCALWDLAAKAAGKRVWEVAGVAAPRPVITCYTLSLGDPASMQAAAEAASHRPLLKVKLGGEGDSERIAAVRRGAPQSRIVVDANEAWTEANFDRHVAACAAARVELIEQPLPAADDWALRHLSSPIPICADESFHGLDKLAATMELYDAINIKLDKTGGLSAALQVAEAARRHEMPVMVGCMLGTSLAMAPAMLIAAGAAFVDLDGPLLLKQDRVPGLQFEGSTIHPYPVTLWG